ncbi:uncharacterized protein [Ambystoma mexicanum]|uniref:uncharacterized protein isoform X2 n=1 Tax=Ambystoma mexicanum TaxID=8296 RepID=UPI0037E9B15F
MEDEESKQVVLLHETYDVPPSLLNQLRIENENLLLSILEEHRKMKEEASCTGDVMPLKLQKPQKRSVGFRMVEDDPATEFLMLNHPSPMGILVDADGNKVQPSSTYTDDPPSDSPPTINPPAGTPSPEDARADSPYPGDTPAVSPTPPDAEPTNPDSRGSPAYNRDRTCWAHNFNVCNSSSEALKMWQHGSTIAFFAEKRPAGDQPTHAELKSEYCSRSRGPRRKVTQEGY